MPAQNRVAAALKVVSILALFAFVFLAPSALAEGLGEAAPENLSAQTESQVESPLRIAQVPSGGGAATKDDIRRQDERNDRRWDEMRAERRADMNEIRTEIRALNSRIDNLFYALLGGMGGFALWALWYVTRRRDDSEARSRGRAPLPSETGPEPAH